MGEGMKKIDADNTFYDDPALIECRAQIDRALGGLNTLHLGPLDYNVATTVDNLLAAVHLLEEFSMRNAP
jgi:hypothetical protein